MAINFGFPNRPPLGAKARLFEARQYLCLRMSAHVMTMTLPIFFACYCLNPINAMPCHIIDPLDRYSWIRRITGQFSIRSHQQGRESNGPPPLFLTFPPSSTLRTPIQERSRRPSSRLPFWFLLFYIVSYEVFNLSLFIVVVAISLRPLAQNATSHVPP